MSVTGPTLPHKKQPGQDSSKVTFTQPRLDELSKAQEILACKKERNNSPLKKMRTLLLPCATLMALAPLGHPQGLTPPRESGGISGVPVITGFMSYQSNIGQGTADVNPEFDPVLLVPIGNKTLLSSEFDMSLDLSHTDGSWGPAVVDHGFDYLQLSYNVSPNLTAVAGRYLSSIRHLP